MTNDRERLANRDNWDDRVGIHWEPDGYDAPGFIADPERISGVVRYDSAHLDVAGKHLLHLQCHFGMDTLSWARLGAQVTGIDFSEKGIAAARRLGEDSGTPGRFVLSDLYRAPSALPGEQFDIVYTGVGAVNWLPDIATWGEVVASFLAPGGTFYMREGHPVMWSLDWEEEDRLVLRHPYFETTAPVSDDTPVTYAGSGTMEHARTYEWNHSIAEVMGALTSQGLRIVQFEEHRAAEWAGHPAMSLEDDGLWRLPEAMRDLAPVMYTLAAVRD